jgi:adenylate kinase
MKIAPVIALLGISGVGKSSMAGRIVRASPDILHLTAGGLLRDALNRPAEHLRKSTRNSVLDNQKILVDALRRERVGRWQIPVLLEVHSIIDNDHELIDVPTDIMRNLDVKALLVLEESADEILTRRQKDTRERPERGLAEIIAQQNRSSSLAGKYAYELSIPIKFIKSDDINQAIIFVKDLISNDANADD